MAIFDNISNPFEGMNVFGARPSEALTGLLTKDQQDKLRNQSIVQGLLGTAATYLATPKNLGVGSALPYLGRAYLSGMQQSQNIYDQALAGKAQQLQLEQGAKRLEMEGLTPLERLMKRRETLSTVQPEDTTYNTAQNQIKILDQAIAKESGGLSSFGAGVEGSALSILARGSQDTPEGIALRKTPQYALAYRNQTSPKTIMQETMDENGNVYTVPVKIQPSALPANILPPEGVQTQPVDMTSPQITTQTGQVTQPAATQTQAPIVKKQAQSKQDIFKQEQDIRKDYINTPEVKAFNEMKTSFGQINAGLNAKSAAGDLTAATKFMKLLDPGSVVRESELYLAMNATGLIDRIANYKARLENGEVLNPKQREDFRNVANQLFKAAENTKLNYDKQYEDIAISNNLNPAKIIVNYKTSKPSSQIRNKADILKAYGVE